LCGLDELVTRVRIAAQHPPQGRVGPVDDRVTGPPAFVRQQIARALRRLLDHLILSP
jgi:hypothetical protein